MDLGSARMVRISFATEDTERGELLHVIHVQPVAEAPSLTALQLAVGDGNIETLARRDRAQYGERGVLDIFCNENGLMFDFPVACHFIHEPFPLPHRPSFIPLTLPIVCSISNPSTGDDMEGPDGIIVPDDIAEIVFRRIIKPHLTELFDSVVFHKLEDTMEDAVANIP